MTIIVVLEVFGSVLLPFSGRHADLEGGCSSAHLRGWWKFSSNENVLELIVLRKELVVLGKDLVEMLKIGKIHFRMRTLLFPTSVVYGDQNRSSGFALWLFLSVWWNFLVRLLSECNNKSLYCRKHRV